MKTKTFSKKLALNKETIANLNRDQMVKLQGGVDTDPNGDKPITESCLASACPGKYTCVDSRCPIVTCTCTCNIHCPEPIDPEPVDPKPVGVVVPY